MIMKKTMKRWLILAGCFPILFLACAGKPADKEAAPAAAEATAGTVVLTEATAGTAGIKTETAGLQTFHPAVKASGTVVLNQKRYVKVSPRVPGRIENVLVYEGDHVRAGQELFRLYSVEALAAQSDYLQILSRLSEPGKNPASDDDKLHESLLESAAARLRLLGFEEADLASLRSGRRALPFLAVRTPMGGTVLESSGVAGGAADPGTPLCAVADLGTVWVQVHIFEKDLASVSAGARAEIAVAAYPGEIFPGTLNLVGSVMDEATRTVAGRVEAANPSGRLKPGMFADVRLVAREALTFLAVPEEAVRTIGGKTVVFVPAGGGKYVRRDVTTGRVVDGWIEILDGLRAGEPVVTGGSFDVKAELLKGTLEGD
jgi:RND family efflux transporter MFP subunit